MASAWSPPLDSALQTAALANYFDWGAVATAVGSGVTAEECRLRYAVLQGSAVGTATTSDSAADEMDDLLDDILDDEDVLTRDDLLDGILEGQDGGPESPDSATSGTPGGSPSTTAPSGPTAAPVVASGKEHVPETSSAAVPAAGHVAEFRDPVDSAPTPLASVPRATADERMQQRKEMFDRILAAMGGEDEVSKAVPPPAMPRGFNFGDVSESDGAERPGRVAGRGERRVPLTMEEARRIAAAEANAELAQQRSSRPLSEATIAAMAARRAKHEKERAEMLRSVRQTVQLSTEVVSDAVLAELSAMTGSHATGSDGSSVESDTSDTSADADSSATDDVSELGSVLAFLDKSAKESRRSARRVRRERRAAQKASIKPSELADKIEAGRPRGDAAREESEATSKTESVSSGVVGETDVATRVAMAPPVPPPHTAGGDGRAAARRGVSFQFGGDVETVTSSRRTAHSHESSDSGLVQPGSSQSTTRDRASSPDEAESSSSDDDDWRAVRRRTKTQAASALASSGQQPRPSSPPPADPVTVHLATVDETPSPSVIVKPSTGVGTAPAEKAPVGGQQAKRLSAREKYAQQRQAALKRAEALQAAKAAEAAKVAVHECAPTSRPSTTGPSDLETDAAVAGTAPRIDRQARVGVDDSAVRCVREATTVNIAMPAGDTGLGDSVRNSGSSGRMTAERGAKPDEVAGAVEEKGMEDELDSAASSMDSKGELASLSATPMTSQRTLDVSVPSPRVEALRTETPEQRERRIRNKLVDTLRSRGHALIHPAVTFGPPLAETPVHPVDGGEATVVTISVQFGTSDRATTTRNLLIAGWFLMLPAPESPGAVSCPFRVVSGALTVPLTDQSERAFVVRIVSVRTAHSRDDLMRDARAFLENTPIGYLDADSPDPDQPVWEYVRVDAEESDLSEVRCPEPSLYAVQQSVGTVASAQSSSSFVDDLSARPARPEVQTIVCVLGLEARESLEILSAVFRSVIDGGLDVVGLRVVYTHIEQCAAAGVQLPDSYSAGRDRRHGRSDTEEPHALPGVLALALRGPHAVQVWQDAVGPADPQLARVTDPNSLRARHGVSAVKSLVTSSRTLDGACRELAFWFGGRLPGDLDAATVTVADASPHATDNSVYVAPYAMVCTVLVVSGAVRPALLGIVVQSCLSRGLSVEGLGCVHDAAEWLTSMLPEALVVPDGSVSSYTVLLLRGENAHSRLSAMLPRLETLLSLASREKSTLSDELATRVETAMRNMADPLAAVPQDSDEAGDAAGVAGGRVLWTPENAEDGMRAAVAASQALLSVPREVEAARAAAPARLPYATASGADVSTVLLLITPDGLSAECDCLGHVLHTALADAPGSYLEALSGCSTDSSAADVTAGDAYSRGAGFELIGAKLLPSVPAYAARQLVSAYGHADDVQRQFEPILSASVKAGDDPFLANAEAFLRQGPVCALVLRRVRAQESLNSLVGPRNLLEARRSAPTSLRAIHAQDDLRCAVLSLGSSRPAHAAVAQLFATHELAADTRYSGGGNGVIFSNFASESDISAWFVAPQSQSYTVAVIRPDAVQRRCLPKALRLWLRSGFVVKHMEMLQLTPPQATLLARHGASGLDVDAAAEHLLSGPVVAVLLERKHAVAGSLAIAGPRSPREARKMFPASIRANFGTDSIRNAIHVPETIEHAVEETRVLFPGVYDGTAVTNIDDAGKREFRRRGAVGRRGTTTAPAAAGANLSMPALQESTCLVVAQASFGPDSDSAEEVVGLLYSLLRDGFCLAALRMVTLSEPEASAWTRLREAAMTQRHGSNWASRRSEAAAAAARKRRGGHSSATRSPRDVMRALLQQKPCLVVGLHRENAVAHLCRVVDSADASLDGTFHGTVFVSPTSRAASQDLSFFFSCMHAGPDAIGETPSAVPVARSTAPVETGRNRGSKLAQVTLGLTDSTKPTTLSPTRVDPAAGLRAPATPPVMSLAAVGGDGVAEERKD